MNDPPKTEAEDEPRPDESLAPAPRSVRITAANAPLPTPIRGLRPDELIARAMQSDPVTDADSRGWLPPAVDDMARLFPQYEVLSLLGRGGMGAVYKARQIELDRLVAIKLLPLEVSVGRDFADRFRREARAMAKLDHPNIIAVYEFGATAEGHLFFVMAFVEGANLHEMIHLADGNPDASGVTPARALEVIGGVCDALAYAHAKGVVHRDIKPANVMVSVDGQVKVADFGLARLTDPASESPGHTVTGTVMGTPDYMAPEQMRGTDVDHRADIYSVGVVLYELLCREVPRGVFALPSARLPGLDARVDQVVIKAMQQQPERRYQSTLEMKSDLSAAGALQLALPEPRLILAPAARAGTSRKRLGVGVAAVIAGGLATAGFFAWRIIPPSSPPAPRTSGSAASQPPPMAQAAGRAAPAAQEAPFVNSLGMKFVPVPIYDGPTAGQRVLFGVWETRVQDYEVFAKETGRDWPKPDFPQGPTHPAVNVSWEDATLFCQWLTVRDQAAGRLAADRRYRLPSDYEWTCAVGLGRREDASMLPSEKNSKVLDVFPWGSDWPPPAGAGNYAGEELLSAVEAGKYRFIRDVIAGYNDGFENTAPVGSFTPNRFGLFDLGGNAMEWCDGWYNQERTNRFFRGGSWAYRGRTPLVSSNRYRVPPDYRDDRGGFRCVIGPSVLPR